MIDYSWNKELKDLELDIASRKIERLRAMIYRLWKERKGMQKENQLLKAKLDAMFKLYGNVI